MKGKTSKINWKELSARMKKHFVESYKGTVSDQLGPDFPKFQITVSTGNIWVRPEDLFKSKRFQDQVQQVREIMENRASEKKAKIEEIEK